MLLQHGFAKKLAELLQEQKKQQAIPIDEQEWMKATEPSIGELPEVEVTAKREPSLYEKGLEKLAGIGEVVEKGIGVIQKPVTKAVEKVSEVVAPVVLSTLGLPTQLAEPTTKIQKAIAGIPFEVAKRLPKDVQIPYYAEKRGEAMHGFVKYFGTKKGQEYATEYQQIEQQMKDQGLLPEQRAITLPVELYFLGNIYRMAHNVSWAKNFKFEWKGHKWTQKEIKSLWNKINTPGSRFSDEEMAAVSELKKQGTKAWHAKEVYLKAKPPVPKAEGALPFRPKTLYPSTVEIEAQRGITPAGELVPRITPTTVPKVIPEAPVGKVSSILSPKTLEIMIGKTSNVSQIPPTPVTDRITMTDLEKRVMEARKGKDIEYMPTKKELPVTRPEVRVYKPEIEKSLVEKYRETHGGEEPPILDEMEIAEEVNRVMTEPTPGAKPGFMNVSPMVKGYEAIHDFIFAHGEAKRLYPELYKQLMSRFHQEGASIEKAVDILNKTVGKTKITPEEETQMAFALEDKRYISAVTNKPVYKKLFKINEMIEKFKLQRGLIKQPFQERMITENEDAIKGLVEQHRAMKLDPSGRPTEEMTAIVEQIDVLQKEIEQVKNMRYLPHKIVAQRVIENRLAELEGEERRVFLDRLSSFFVKRKGKGTLKEMVETGLLKPEEVRLTRLTLQNIDDYYRKVAIQELHANAKMNGFIKPFSQRLKEEGWKTPQEVGVIAPELKGQLLHPVYAKALEQIKEMKMGRGGAIRQLFGAVKVSQFIKPTILLFYDGVQAIMRGMWSFNPLKTMKFSGRAVSDVLHKSAMYHQLNKLGLYQHPAELPRAAREETANIALNHLDATKPKWRTGLSRITGMSWDKGDIKAKDVVLTPIRVLAQVAWAGDKAIRTASVYALMDMGYPIEEAVDVAAKGHGGYSLLSPKYRKTMGMLTFVHSFRVLMPIEIAKTAYEPVMGVINAKTKGQNIPPYKKKRWAKAIIGSLIIPAATETYFRARGFKPDKLGWKWKKIVKDPQTDEEREVVVTVNNIINMPLKWYHRLAYHNPIVGTKLDYYYQKVKWEIHPIYRTGVDIFTNKPSMAGELRQVYNPSASVFEKLGQVTLYAMRNMFRHTELIARAVEGETLTRKEREIEDRIMKEALTWYERIIFGRDSPLGFGYAYARTNKEKVGAYWWCALISEHKSRLRDLEKYEDSEVKEKVRKSINNWFEYCKKWLKKEYDFEPFVQEEVEVKPEKQVMKRGYAKELAEQIQEVRP